MDRTLRRTLVLFVLYSAKVQLAMYMNETEERNDSLRAAAYFLQTLGIPYIWPGSHLDKLKPLLNKTIVILNNMINPPNDSWGFLDMDGKSVREQIIVLQERRNAII